MATKAIRFQTLTLGPTANIVQNPRRRSLPLPLAVEFSSKIQHLTMEEVERKQTKKQVAEMEEDAKTDKIDSPTNSQQTISDDDEIDYSIKPELYDPNLDDKDELWVQNKRKGRHSDAVLSCPACFTTLCLECQRHERYVTQYRAIFVVNCKIEHEKVREDYVQPKKDKRRRESIENEAVAAGGETFKPVCCSVCLTEVGVIDEDEVYHFFNVLPSES